MAQKVQFIAPIVSQPKLLILDEPFSGLDPVNAEALRDAVLELRREGTTVVFSTHDMGAAERLCDRIFMIFKGRKVLDGSLDEIQRDTGTTRFACASAPARGARQAPRASRASTITAISRTCGSRVDAQAFLRDAGRAHRGPPVRNHEAVAARHLRAHRETDGRGPARGRGGGVMNRILTVAQTEFLSLVRTKAFIIGILLVPVLMVGVHHLHELRRGPRRHDGSPDRRDRRNRRALGTASEGGGGAQHRRRRGRRQDRAALHPGTRRGRRTCEG